MRGAPSGDGAPLSKAGILAGRRVAWGLMLALLALYGVGFLLGWGGYASWHLLLVVAAILLIFNLLSRR